MKLKLLVITKHRWRSRKKKHRELKQIMAPAFDEIEVVTKHRDLGKPDTYLAPDGTRRISEDWFERNISSFAKANGFNHAVFHFSMEEGRRWGIRSGLRGVNYRDRDYFGESWVQANENSVARFEDGTKRDRYTKVIGHEIGHELKNKRLTDREIHDYDFGRKINNLEGFYRDLVLRENVHGTIFEHLRHVVGLYGRYFEKTEHFFHTPYRVSQPFGVLNSRYPQTGVHIGTDYATPVGTIGHAILTGTITEVGTSEKLGYYCHFHCLAGRFRIAHLHQRPELGLYAQGEPLFVTGNTGESTGPHVHIEGWQRPINVPVLTRENIPEYLFNIETVLPKLS